MEVTAPHLTHAIPTLMPVRIQRPRHQAVAARAATWAGDLLRRGARTSVRHAAPPPPPLRDRGAPARAAAARGRACAARCSAGTVSSRTTPGWSPRWPAPPRRTARTCAPAPGWCPRPAPRSELRDELNGATHSVTARAVVNAAGVWAGDLVEEVRLRPSRGTHLVLREETLPGLRVVVYRARSRAPSTGSCWSSPSPTARSTSVSPTSPPTARSPTCRSRPSPRSASCSTWSRRRSSSRCTAPTWWVRSPGCVRCSTCPATARPPTSRGGTPC